MDGMNEKTFDIIKSTFCTPVYIIMRLAKGIFETELTDVELCVSESMDEVIENLGVLASLAENGYEDARKILDHVKNFVTSELTEGTYILGDKPAIDRVCEYVGNLMEYLSGADESVKTLFLSAIKEATLKLGLTIDIGIEDADVRWLFNCALASQR